jgi:hypothetical protein
MAKTVTHIFVVSGTGEFPIDMLRYDRATPSSSADSAVIQRSFRGRDYRAVRLTSEKAPTVGRWESYGWKVFRHDDHLRIVAVPGTHDWNLIGTLFGREAVIDTGTLYSMIDARCKLERAEA